MILMKQFVLLAVSAALLVSGTMASAQTIDSVPNSHSIPVQARYQCLAPSATVYSVDVEWEELQFTYTHTGTKTWNPQTHQYHLEASGQWSSKGNQFTVTNHSNASVQVNFDFDSQDNHVTGSFSNPFPRPKKNQWMTLNSQVFRHSPFRGNIGEAAAFPGLAPSP